MARRSVGTTLAAATQIYLGSVHSCQNSRFDYGRNYQGTVLSWDWLIAHKPFTFAVYGSCPGCLHRLVTDGALVSMLYSIAM